MGPISLTALEILYAARCIDGETPISGDGHRFVPLGRLSELRQRLEAVARRAASGEPVWRTPVAARATLEETMDWSSPRPPARWLLDVARSRATGVLRCRDSGLQLAFRDGRLADVGNSSYDEFGEWLVETGRVTPRALQKLQGLDGELAVRIVASGLMTPQDFMEAWGGFARARVGRLLLEGTPEKLEWASEPVAPPTLALGIDRTALLLEAARTLDPVKLARRVDLWGRRVLMPSHVEGVELPELSPTPRELRALRSVDGRSDATQASRRVGAPEEVRRALFVAVEAGLCVLGVDPGAERDADAIRILRAELEDMARQPDARERLGVSPSAPLGEVRQRYRELARRYHTDGLPPDASPELRAVRQQLIGLVNESFAEVERSTTQESGPAPGAEPTPEAPADPSVLRERATALARKAEVSLRVKKYDEARSIAETGLGMVADHPDLLVVKAWVDYLVQARARPQDAVSVARRSAEVIQRALRDEPELLNGHLWLAQLLVVLDKPEQSLRHYKQVLRLDPEQPDALRAVRLARTREEKKKKRLWGR